MKIDTLLRIFFKCGTPFQGAKGVWIIVFVVCLPLFTNAQFEYIDSLLLKLDTTKDEEKQFDLIFDIFSPEFETAPNQIIETGYKLLEQAQENDDQLSEACALSFLGQGYRLAGNSIKGLDYHLRAVQAAEKVNNESVMGLVKNQMANIYKDRQDNDKAIQLYKEANEHAKKGSHDRLKVWPLMNLGATFLNAGMPDSALMSLQRAYSESLILKYDKLLSYILTNLGGAQSKLGNNALAVTYYHMAIAEAIKNKSIRYQNMAYTGIAEHYCARPVNDSCTYYSKKAVSIVEGTIFSYMSIKPSWMMTIFYDQADQCDSTLKYARIHKRANDSLFTAKADQQIQLMTFEEDQRQRDLLISQRKAAAQRQQNIRYALLGISVLLLVTIFLTLSHRFVTNTRYIHFFSILAMLLVFEFLNLVLHPFLGKITHHIPSLMLLGLVCIGAVLVPLHHRLEKWAIEKLTQKNKDVRLARAKKTIETLGG
ncbi:MAG TPA: tetratricopeptide repeat protein, partial [Saprospiraceae bacterium]